MLNSSKEGKGREERGGERRERKNPDSCHRLKAVVESGDVDSLPCTSVGCELGVAGLSTDSMVVARGWDKITCVKGFLGK
jgi:hypothetical protein